MSLSRLASGRPTRLMPWFGLIGLVLVSTLLAAAFVQVRQYALLNMTLQYQDDYLVLSLYQVETEYLRLSEQLQRDLDTPASPAVQLRYDIFVSRVGLLDNDRARRLLANRPLSQQLLHDMLAFIAQADQYLGNPPSKPLDPAAARTLQQALGRLAEPIHEVMLEATHAVARQITDRQVQVRQHNEIGLWLTAFLSCMVLVFALIALQQMRTLEQRRRRLELLADQLRDARIEAEAASEAKSDFLADMSHELRTPLHGLLGMLSLLKDSPRDPQAEQWLGTADDSAQHLLRLLDDILDLSKLESGALALVNAPVALAPLLNEVRALMQPAVRAKGLGLALEIDSTLPEQVQLDATRLRQVLFNLLVNAVKYSEAGQIVLRCRRHRAASGDQLEFDVADTGIGMDPQVVAGLFRRFSRADDPRARHQPGTGLGLAISRNLARLMGGEIVVRSTPGAGSVFSLRLPLHPVQAAALPAPDPQLLLPERTLRVLVAEDHPVNRLYLQALLERLGHAATLVDDGQAALHAVQQQWFDLVLMDVHMPVMDGVAATQAIRALGGATAQVRIVALTADVFADTRQRCLRAGVHEVLTKPLGLPALQALLSRHFGLDAAPSPAPRPLASTSDPSPGGAPALLDHAMIASVRELMGAHQVPRLYGGFFDQASDAARRMREAMRDADPEALRRAAHTVKGAALNLGLPALADAASTLSREGAHLAAAHLALAVQRFEETATASRQLCMGEGLLTAPP